MKRRVLKYRDLIICTLIALVLSLAAVQMEAHEWWHQITRAYSHWNMAELSGVLMALLVGASWFFWSRARRLRHEVRRRDLAARTLEGGEARLREFLDGMSDLFQSVAPDGTLVYANRAWRESLGYSEEELTGARIFEFVPPEDRNRCKAVLQDIMRDGGEREIEITLNSKSGEAVTVSGNARCRVAQGNPVTTEFLFCDVTAQRKAEDELRRNQRLLEATFRIIPASVVAKDKNGRYLMANEEFARSMNETPQSLVGHTFAETGYGTTEEQMLVVAQDAEVLETGRRIETLEFPLTRCDGQKEWRHVIKVPLRDDEGNITGLVAVSDDVTRLKNARDALRESEQRFRQFAESSSDWFWEMDENLRFTYMSDRVAEVTGVPVSFHMGKTRQELAGNLDEPEKWARHFNDLESRRPFRNFTYWRTGPNGKRQYMSSSGFPVYDEAGDFQGYRGTGADLTGQKLAEEELSALNAELEQRVAGRTNELQKANDDLARAQRQLSVALESTSDAFVVYDADERLVVCNSRYREIYRESAELMRPGNKFEDIIRDFYRKDMIHGSADDVEKRIRTRLEKFRNPKAPYEYQLTDGRWLPVEEYRTSDGGVVGLRKDITEHKRSEEQLKRQQLQLIHADKTASLGILVAGMAHEINNPNTAIMLNAPLPGRMWAEAIPALEEYCGENPDYTIANIPFQQVCKEIPSLLEGIISSSKRINHIVNNLKNFGRINEDHSPAQINNNDVVELAISLLKSQINKFTDDFSVEYENDIPQFEGHFHEIEQVVINLVNNACQALANRKQKVCVRTIYNPGPRLIKVEVSDEGEGIPGDILGKIMGPFFRTRGNAGGTGLGLSVSFGILEEHGGGLHFDSAVGRGATATVTLPTAMPRY